MHDRLLFHSLRNFLFFGFRLWTPIKSHAHDLRQKAHLAIDDCLIDGPNLEL